MRENETPYAETEALLHILNDDTEAARRIVNDMFLGELTLFGWQVDELRLMIGNAYKARLAENRKATDG